MAVEVPGVVLVELFLQFGLFGDQGIEVGVGIGKLGIDIVIAGSMSTMGCTASFTTSMTVFDSSNWLLLKQPNGVALGHGDVADVVLIHAHDDAQQGGLARAVQTQHADLGAVIETE